MERGRRGPRESSLVRTVFGADGVAYAAVVQLLEREHPLEVLAERAHHAVAGRGGVVLVAGEAGIGKTVLLRAFVERVRATAQPLWGMCDSLSTPRPLGPLRDVADELGAPVSDLLHGTAAPHEIFGAVLDVLRSRPRVFVVEDLHWGDEATLDLVRFVARRITALPLLLVVSYRDTLGTDHSLSPVLGDLVSVPEVRRLQLAPLSRAAVATLLDAPRTRPKRRGPDAADVHRRTAGNPFFVSQILAQPESPLPVNVRDAVLARIAGLAPSARRSLELLSCTPEPIGPALLGALDVSRTTVGVLAATGLVDRHGKGVAFRHEIARAAVLEATAPGAEPELHATMIDALEAVGGDPSLLAHHATASGDVPRILRYAPEAAAEAARSGAHREAVAFYQTALRHVGDDPATRAALLEALSVELDLADRLHDAVAAQEQALELRRGQGGRRGGRRRAHRARRLRVGCGRPCPGRAARRGRHRDPLRDRRPEGPGVRAGPAARSSRPGAATLLRRDGRAAGRRGSPTSWTTSCCAPPRPSGSRWCACSRATYRGGPTSSRPPTSVLRIASTDS